MRSSAGAPSVADLPSAAPSSGRVQFAPGGPTLEATDGIDGFLSWLDTTKETPETAASDDAETPVDLRAVIEEAIEELVDDPPRRWMDLDDVDHFTEVANRVYNELSARLRFDLLVERERAGSLMDRN